MFTVHITDTIYILFATPSLHVCCVLFTHRAQIAMLHPQSYVDPMCLKEHGRMGHNVM